MLASARVAHEAGEASELDVLRAEVRRLDASEGRVGVEAQARAARSDLARAIGRRDAAGAVP
jgi:outer membrane protein TolC